MTYRLLSIEKEPFSQPLDGALPTEAINKEYGLSWWNPAVFESAPVLLYKHRWEVYRWNYVPSIIEVWEKINELEASYHNVKGEIMPTVGETKKTRCTFCGKEIDWDYEFMDCPECNGTGDDPITGDCCPYCFGDGLIEADPYLPCCEICFEQEYLEEESERYIC